MQIAKEESGFYFGTTSIGYVLAILVVIIPVCILVVQEIIGMWTGIAIGIIGSVLLCTLTYPLLLCWVIACFYLVQPQEVSANQESLKD